MPLIGGRLRFRVLCRPRAALTTLTLVTLGAGGLIPLFTDQAGAVTTVFVNELHYDNASADAGEGLEIAGPAGTDLAGWTTQLYNGLNGSTYGSVVALTGILPDQQGGFGTAWFPIEGIQNGSPDGFALVDPSGAVVQFSSYEGTFTGTEGPASGLVSQDIGVAEDGTEPTGQSLQLIGTGSTAEEFAWSGAATATPSAVNDGQSFAGGECTINGTEASETLTGTTGADHICGAGGNDTLIGLGGDDLLDGGEGDDTLRGGAGDDTLLGAAGNDRLEGAGGDDVLDGGDGMDTADYVAAPGDVTVDLELGSSHGAAGVDALTGLERIFGSQTGDDHLTGRDDQANSLFGRGGNDGLFGRAGNDRLYGGPGDDYHEGGQGNDLCSDLEGSANEFVNCERR
jgi:Ca2+-binding RTX toxin-like protein